MYQDTIRKIENIVKEKEIVKVQNQLYLDLLEIAGELISLCKRGWKITELEKDDLKIRNKQLGELLKKYSFKECESYMQCMSCGLPDYMGCIDECEVNNALKDKE